MIPVKTLRRALPALLLPLSLLGTTPAVAALGDQFLDRIVAVVEKDIITHTELQQQVKRTVQELRARGVTSVSSRQALIEKALSDLIDTRLLLAEADRLGLATDDATVEKAVAAIGRENNLTVAQLEDTLRREGMAPSQFRDEIRSRLTRERLIKREVTNRLQVTKAEVDHFIATEGLALSARDAVHLQHILIATPENPTVDIIEAARQRATDILTRLQAGEDFARVAQEVSDSGKALEGGDLGWLDMAQVPDVFAVPASKMKKGAVEGPLQNSGGFHIIRLVDYRGGDRNIVTQTRARHILMQPGESLSGAEAMEKLDKLAGRIRQGVDFAELAKASSMDQVSAIKGGELGWVNPGEMVPEFEAEMDKLEPGQISEPFRSRFGFHIVQVLERRQHDATEEAMRSKAQIAVRERKLEESLALYLQRLRDEAYIDIRREDLSTF